MDFGGSECSEEKVYEVYIWFVISWCAVPNGIEAVSYKRLFRVSPIFSDFTETFLELLLAYSYNVKLRLLLKCLFCYELL